ncbi:hypothetical protein IWW55_007033, partial [Coemansia sp. RSA 2706]
MTLDDIGSAPPRSSPQPQPSPSPEPVSRTTSPPSSFLTGSSQLPIRTTGNRSRLTSTRAAPYSLAQSPRYLSAGDRANIPRT